MLRELDGRFARDTEQEKGDGEMQTGIEDRYALGSRGHSPSLPLPSSQPLPWVSGASGATSLAKGFPGMSEGPSPLQPSRFREITASLKRGYDSTSHLWLCWVFVAARELSLVAASGGCLLSIAEIGRAHV